MVVNARVRDACVLTKGKLKVYRLIKDDRFLTFSYTTNYKTIKLGHLQAKGHFDIRNLPKKYEEIDLDTLGHQERQSETVNMIKRAVDDGFKLDSISIQ
ncbi:MAG: hypothetical protein EOP45_07705 [Sphingobacteriaceae bacterium]|nr:MAG: hypothetical protein EOP45_07705 [Sphingobacteriaceae bacterium]